MGQIQDKAGDSPMTPTLLLILDGWGIAANNTANATYVAKTPNIDSLMNSCPHSRLAASGRSVGLPEGYMGNSEVGHLNIGAGRVVYQDMALIDVAIENGSFFKNPVLGKMFSAIKSSNGTLHLAGLLSDGGVHSHINHLKAICSMADKAGIPVSIHCIMDGRDTDPHSGVNYVKDLQKAISGLSQTRIASVVGRFYAMDRDNRWDRVHKAWELFVHGKGEDPVQADPVKLLEDSYAAEITDEFVKPTLCYGDGMKDGDGLFLFNFRADRMREITKVAIDPTFEDFDRGYLPRFALVASMTPYDAHFDIPVAFPKEAVPMGLGEVVSNLGMKQLRLAETEKYAHVTYFFNGGIEAPFAGEDRVLIPSPREVATYDLKPAMSAREVTDKFVESWMSGNYNLIVCNLANGDMVGHTGKLDSAIEACATVDECVGRMVEAVKSRNGRMLLIADHGNCEQMLTPDGRQHTAHTTNPVPCILLDPDGDKISLENGKLADVAPTLLALWGLEPSTQMNGQNLVTRR